MKYLCENLKELNKFKNDTNTAIVTDIDGTISEIASTPNEAFVSPSMRNQLVKLNNKYKLVVVISGRSVVNAREMVGVDGLLYVGNHGLEYLKNSAPFLVPEAEEYMKPIEETLNLLKNGKLSKTEGLMLENKGVCLSIHYRGCKNPEIVRENILKTLHDLPSSKNLNVTEGRKLVECKPPLGYDKGLILDNIIEKYNLKKIIYLGDDITDLDAFIKLKELESIKKINGISILVNSSEIPDYVKKGSSFFVEEVNEILEFFQWLLN